MAIWHAAKDTLSFSAFEGVAAMIIATVVAAHLASTLRDLVRDASHGNDAMSDESDHRQEKNDGRGASRIGRVFLVRLRPYARVPPPWAEPGSILMPCAAATA